MPASHSFKSPTFSAALRITWPVMVGYFPMAIAFGLLYGKILLSFFSGLLVYAGAAQFLSVKLFEDRALLTEVWISTLFLNLRHVFYSLHFLSRYQRFPWGARLYSIFALTDETYSILVHNRGFDALDDAKLVWRISLLNQATWVSGCVLGAVFSSTLSLKIKGLDFFLVGLFVVLLVEEAKKSAQWTALGVAVVVGTLCAATGHSLWLFWAMGACVVYGLIFSSHRRTHES